MQNVYLKSESDARYAAQDSTGIIGEDVGKGSIVSTLEISTGS